jgi:hypothetical protein
VIALVVSVVASIAQPRAASCPPGAWINGITPDGSYSCLLTVGDNDSPAVETTTGRLWCAPSERPLVVDYRRARCTRRR